MCGRYALALPPSRVRRYLEEANMPADDAPDDDDVRQTYNFAPGYYGLVYREDVPDHGARSSGSSGNTQQARPDEEEEEDVSRENGTEGVQEADEDAGHGSDQKAPAYKLQAMKWGLVPFWTKRNPDYGTLMRTINCRDDSLISPGGMWHTMKERKRCIVVAQGFYEWLKKNDGKEKIPHFVKRKDGQLMCFAGLWDSVKYEDAEQKLFTYSIITTNPNKQLTFLHDRMPVILENGSDDVFTWLDSKRNEWSKELQSLLKPFQGELECYPVSKEVGKVGNNSPAFIVPINSAENKQNIANFFGNQKKNAEQDIEAKKDSASLEQKVETDGAKVEQDPRENRQTMDDEDDENNAPKPLAGTKRTQDIETGSEAEAHQVKSPKTQTTPQKSPKKQGPISSKRSKSATSNEGVGKASSAKSTGSSHKITSFFVQ